VEDHGHLTTLDYLSSQLFRRNAISTWMSSSSSGRTSPSIWLSLHLLNPDVPDPMDLSAYSKSSELRQRCNCLLPFKWWSSVTTPVISCACCILENLVITHHSNFHQAALSVNAARSRMVLGHLEISLISKVWFGAPCPKIICPKNLLQLIRDHARKLAGWHNDCSIYGKSRLALWAQYSGNRIYCKTLAKTKCMTCRKKFSKQSACCWPVEKPFKRFHLLKPFKRYHLLKGMGQVDAAQWHNDDYDSQKALKRKDMYTYTNIM